MLSKSSGANAATVRSILSAMGKDGIICVRRGTGGAMIACDLEEISLYRICAAVEPGFLEKMMGMHPSPSAACPVGRSIRGVLARSYGRLSRDVEASMRAITMRDILSDYADARDGRASVDTANRKESDADTPA